MALNSVGAEQVSYRVTGLQRRSDVFWEKKMVCKILVYFEILYI